MKLTNLGFTLLELMAAIVIIAFLAVLLTPKVMHVIAKSKRAEAFVNLSSLATAEKIYWAENGKYTTVIGSGGLNWKPSANVNYTYGFADGENIIGVLKTPASELAGAYANVNDFLIFAACDIDGDGFIDRISIDSENNVKIVQDDLA